MTLRERWHDGNSRHRDLLLCDSAAREDRRQLRRRDEEAIGRRLHPVSVGIEIGEDDAERKSIPASLSIRREDLAGKKVRRQHRIGVEVAHEPAKSSELEPIEQPHEPRLEISFRRTVARRIEITPDVGRAVHHLEIALHVPFSIDRLSEVEHVPMKDFRPRPERTRRFLQSHRRARVSGSRRDRENEEPLHRRDCSTRRIAATRMPMTTTAARALSFPMRRAKRAPA